VHIDWPDLLYVLQITWSGDSTGDGIDLDLDDVLSIANSQELGVSQHCHSTDEWSVPAPSDACHLQFWHGDDSCMSGSTVSLSQVVQTGVQGADTDEADECWWPLDRREAPGVMDYAAEGVRYVKLKCVNVIHAICAWLHLSGALLRFTYDIFIRLPYRTFAVPSLTTKDGPSIRYLALPLELRMPMK
jgi:hypothetical protein